MTIFDISLPVSPAIPVWPDDPQVVLRRTMSLDDGDGVNVSHLSCSVHTGTHVDTPIHFIQGGSGADKLPLDALIGPAYVGHLGQAREITIADLERMALPPHTQRLLLRTRNSELWAQGTREFTPDYVALTPEAAEWVVDQGIRLIGVDYLSVQRFHDPEPTTHRTLLSAGVVIIEGLDLSEVQPGTYQLICLPMKLVGSDGAPARAVLVREP